MTTKPPAAFALNPEVISDVFPADLIKALGGSVTIDPADVVRSFNGLPRGQLADVEILITSWGGPRIDERALETLPKLRAIVHAAGSVKGHVGAEVFDHGIQVSSAASANATPVAEYTIAMLVLAAKHAFARAHSYGAGVTRPGFVTGEDSGMAGITIGVIGASRIGRMVIERLRGFDVDVLLTDPYLSQAEADALGAGLATLDDLLRRSDLVTVHAPQLPDTRQLLNADRLALLHDGAAIVNTARGSLIDTTALTRECESGRLSAILDVTEPEPLPPEHQLHHLPNVLVTPHLAGSRGRELRRIGEFAVADVRRFVRDEPMRGQVHAYELDRIA